jgi:hypothetical protein
MTIKLSSIKVLVFLLLVVCIAPGDFSSVKAQTNGNTDWSKAEVYEFDGLYAQLEDYFVRYHDPEFPYDPYDMRGHFSLQPGKAQDLYGSIDMVYVLYTLGELDERTTKEGRQEWVSVIQSYQDPQTGWIGKGNEAMHFKAHSTAYATGALTLLGAKPLYPFHWKNEIIESRQSTEKWLNGIWWDLVWVGSHSGGGMASALEMTGEAPDEWFDWYLDWLEKEVNPETGLWQRAWYNSFYKNPTMHDMGGAAHFWWIYQHRGRPMPYPEKAIKSLLDLQLESGMWDKKPRKGDLVYCINLDAVNGLRHACKDIEASGGSCPKEEIAQSLDRFLKRSAEYLNGPDCLEKNYTDSHDLPGLITIVEANAFFEEFYGVDRIKTKNKWQAVLDKVSWL